LLSGLQNLRSGLDGLTLENFVVNTLEVLMHLERDEYLEEIKNHHLIDKGNDTYPRSFKSFSKNSLFINIPRTRYTDFKPVVLEFLIQFTACSIISLSCLSSKGKLQLDPKQYNSFRNSFIQIFTPKYSLIQLANQQL
jgi:hypothetical protein